MLQPRGEWPHQPDLPQAACGLAHPSPAARPASTAPAPARAAPTFGTRFEEAIMAQCLFRTFVLVMLAIALLAPSPSRAGDKVLRDTIAFASTRDNPTASFATAIEI